MNASYAGSEQTAGEDWYAMFDVNLDNERDGKRSPPADDFGSGPIRL